ncbi:MAG: hypothetical protein V3U30_03615 [Thermoplasmata archaeon]
MPFFQTTHRKQVGEGTFEVSVSSDGQDRSLHGIDLIEIDGRIFLQPVEDSRFQHAVKPNPFGTPEDRSQAQSRAEEAKRDEEDEEKGPGHA